MYMVAIIVNLNMQLYKYHEWYPCAFFEENQISLHVGDKEFILTYVCIYFSALSLIQYFALKENYLCIRPKNNWGAPSAVCLSCTAVSSRCLLASLKSFTELAARHFAMACMELSWLAALCQPPSPVGGVFGGGCSDKLQHL